MMKLHLVLIISITISFVFEDEDLMESIHSFLNEMGLDEDEITIFEIAKEKKVLKTLSVIDEDEDLINESRVVI